MQTRPKRISPSDQILQQWQQHWPFERASADLIRQAQQVVRQQKREQPQGEPAPL